MRAIGLGAHALALAAVLLVASTGLAVELARDGRARAVIVTPDKPSKVEQYAARELAEYLKKSTGAEFRIQRESRPVATPAAIYVGHCKRTGEVVDIGGLGPDGLRIKTSGAALFLVGMDKDADKSGYPVETYDGQFGTLYAVYEFLESQLGVRWLRPGESGEVVPRHGNLSIPELDVSYTPKLTSRRPRLRLYSIRQGLQRKARGDVRRRPNTPAPTQASRVRARRQLEELRKPLHELWVWYRRMRLGRSERGYGGGHAYGGYYRKYHKAHPEWFALQLDGTRDQPRTKDGRLCVSNPGLIEHVAKRVIDFYKAAPPEARSYSITPNDGNLGFCVCKKCEALDAANGPVIKLPYLAADGRKVVKDHVSLTDRFVYFYNEVAKRVAREFPDKYVYVYAYSAYRDPPVQRRLHKNVEVRLVTNNEPLSDPKYDADGKRVWEGWARMSDGRRFSWRPNFMHWHKQAYPIMYYRKYGGLTKLYTRMGMRGVDWDTCPCHFGTQGPNYYILAKLLWDPDAEIDAVERDYLDSAFGPASGAMKGYLKLWEDWTRGLAAKNLGHKLRKLRGAQLFDHLDKATLDRAAAFLDAADRAAAGRPDVLRRINFFRQGLEYTRLTNETMRAAHLYKKTGKGVEGLVKLVERREKLYGDMTNPWVVLQAERREVERPQTAFGYPGYESYRQAQEGRFVSERFTNPAVALKRMLSSRNVSVTHRSGGFLMLGGRKEDAVAVWRVERDQPMTACELMYYAKYVDGKGLGVEFSVSVDDGKRWEVFKRELPLYRRPGVSWRIGSVRIDLTPLVKGRKSFLARARIPYVKGVGRSSARLISVEVTTTP